MHWFHTFLHWMVEGATPEAPHAYLDYGMCIAQ